jgi:hypothetical protein
MACLDHAALFKNETAATGQLLVTGQSRYDQSMVFSHISVILASDVW